MFCKNGQGQLYVMPAFAGMTKVISRHLLQKGYLIGERETMLENVTTNYILADARWHGRHGIGRFSQEVLARLTHADVVTEGPRPLALKNLLWQSRLLSQKQRHRVYFTPGFNPVLRSTIPYILTIHDLIHLRFPGKAKWLKQFFYAACIKPSAKKAYKIATVSQYSKQCILEWTGMPEEKVVVVGNGISACFTPNGPRYEPGFAYLLHVGNTKEHKNVARLIQAFANATIDKEIKLISTGQFDHHLMQLIHRYGVQDRVLSHTNLSEEQLANYYRGAKGIVFPSLYEGFGLPVLEGMASGVPVLTSNTTSMPEVAGDAAFLVNPYQVDAISHGMDQLVNDLSLRNQLIGKGLEQAKRFSWDATAQKIQILLDEFR